MRKGAATHWAAVRLPSGRGAPHMREIPARSVPNHAAGQRAARATVAAFWVARLRRRPEESPRRPGFDLADRDLERQPLAGDVGFLERRPHRSQLRQQSRARPFVERAPIFAVVLVETGDGARDERIVVGHRR
jgi:hypothetical protein